MKQSNFFKLHAARKTIKYQKNKSLSSNKLETNPALTVAEEIDDDAEEEDEDEVVRDGDNDSEGMTIGSSHKVGMAA